MAENVFFELSVFQTEPVNMLRTNLRKEKNFFSFPSAINHILAEGKFKTKTKKQPTKTPTALEQSF